MNQRQKALYRSIVLVVAAFFIRPVFMQFEQPVVSGGRVVNSIITLNIESQAH